MLTTAQMRRLYFPAWNRCFQATWIMSRGRLELQPTSPESDARDMVELVAARFAERRVEAVRPDDLRYAANALALQKARSHRAGSGQPLPLTPESASSKQLDGLALDLFRALCNLIVEPDLLGTDEQPGMLWWQSPEVPDRIRMIRIIEVNTTPGYAGKLSLDIYGVRDFHTLGAREITALYHTIRGRRNAWARRPARSPVSA